MPIQMSEDDIRAVYRQGEDAVVSLITMLVDRLNSLEEEVTHLKGIVNKNSHNSSKPPSSDFKRPAPKSLRKKGKRKSGGQPGHKGFTLRQVEKPDKRIFLTLPVKARKSLIIKGKPFCVGTTFHCISRSLFGLI